MLAELNEYFSEITNNLKLKAILAFPVMLLSGIFQEIILLVFLVFIDTITGAMYALKNKNFTSHRFRDSMFKLITYIIVILAARTFERLFVSIYETTFVTTFIIIVIGITEFSSICENLIGLGVPIPKKELLYIITKSLKSRRLEKFINNNEFRSKIERNSSMLLVKYVPLISDESIREAITIKYKICIDNVLDKILEEDFSDPKSSMSKLDMNLKNSMKLYKNALVKRPKLKKAAKIIAKHQKDHMENFLTIAKEMIFSKKINVDDKKLQISDNLIQTLLALLNDLMLEKC